MELRWRKNEKEAVEKEEEEKQDAGGLSPVCESEGWRREQDPSVGSGTQTRGHEGPRPTTEKQPHTAGPRNLIGPAPQTKDLHAGRARESSICVACC